MCKKRFAVSPLSLITECAIYSSLPPEHGLTTAEAVTIAQQLVNREKTRTELVNDGFNRYSLNSKEGLPSWFLDEEAKHYKPNLPITKEAVAALRAKMRALDARPIKKVAEAKARKKFKAAQRLEKAMKKAEGVNETTDMTEREKAKQIEKLMMKGMASKKKKEVNWKEKNLVRLLSFKYSSSLSPFFLSYPYPPDYGVSLNGFVFLNGTGLI